MSLEYKPLEIGIEYTSKEDNPSSLHDIENEILVDKLLDHLNTIKDFRDRVDAIDHLIKGAEKLAGNPKYTTTDESLISDIKLMGETGNVIDFQLFKKSIDVVVSGYKQMALVAITGAAND